MYYDTGLGDRYICRIMNFHGAGGCMGLGGCVVGTMPTYSMRFYEVIRLVGFFELDFS